VDSKQRYIKTLRLKMQSFSKKMSRWTWKHPKAVPPLYPFLNALTRAKAPECDGRL
jgi:hypothetical protein